MINDTQPLTTREIVAGQTGVSIGAQLAMLRQLFDNYFVVEFLLNFIKEIGDVNVIDAAVKAEREACAKTVERISWSSPSVDAEHAMRQVAKIAAADIRARSQPPEADNG